PQRRTPGLDAALSIGRAARRMLAQLAEELGIAARVLVQQLDAGRAGAVGLADLSHPAAFDLRCGARNLLGKLLALVGLGAIAAARDDQRGGAVGIVEAEMQDGKAADRDPDHMRLLDLEPVEHRADVVPRPLLR